MIHYMRLRFPTLNK
ncbi:erythromycin resistance leader peptide [Oceanobacillus sp. 1P07AA]